MNENDLAFMKEALKEAETASALGEVPVGAVLVKDGKILSRRHNLRETGKRAIAHAEILCIEDGCAAFGGWRLTGCTLYVTLEPCPMCAGAIINARVSRVVYGAKDFRAGAFGSLLDLSAVPLGFRPEIVGDVLRDESLALLRTFFEKKRQRETLQEKQKTDVKKS